jgi:undecaprenyl-phosphate 4-deoxy-4-formamido-L-arabinose transferase
VLVQEQRPIPVEKSGDTFSEAHIHLISIVVPVYRGETTLPDLLAEIEPLVGGFVTSAGNQAQVTEVLLVHDNGPDRSASVIRQLAVKYPFIRPVWLSRNFGQHAATLAGVASSGGEWVATIDEDGQYDPAQIGFLLDAALALNSALVYAEPINSAPHGFVRNAASKTSKRIVDLLSGSRDARKFHSFRLILGEVGRSVAAYAGSGVYLDVALSWVVDDAVTAPVILREEGDRKSGYNLRRLLGHFWRLVLTSGTRSLRIVSGTGAVIAFGGLLMALFTLIQALVDRSLPSGWASTMIVILVIGGVVLLSLGVIAEYIGVAVNQSMGKPPYLIISDPANSPLGQSRNLQN